MAKIPKLAKLHGKTIKVNLTDTFGGDREYEFKHSEDKTWITYHRIKGLYGQHSTSPESSLQTLVDKICSKPNVHIDII